MWSAPELSEEARAEREAQQARREALLAASEARRAHLRRLASQRIAKGEVLQHVVQVFVSAGTTLEWEDYEAAWHLLGIEEENTEDPDPHLLLAAYAARGVDQAARTGLALAFALSEGFLASTWSADWGQARAHLGFLERHGYVLSEAERHELDEAGAEQDPETAEAAELEAGE